MNDFMAIGSALCVSEAGVDLVEEGKRLYKKYGEGNPSLEKAKDVARETLKKEVKNAIPGWVIPAGVGLGALLIFTLIKK